MTTEQARAARLLEKHQDRPMVDVAVRFYRRDRESAGTVVGSAVAFRLFLFFVPLLLFFVGILGFVANWVDNDDVREGTGITGSLATQINSALNQPTSTRWIAIGVGLLGIVTTGRALSKVLVSASCLAWRLPVQTKASPKVVGGIMGLIVSIGLIALIVNRVRAELGVGVASISFLAAFALYVVAWMILHAMLPRGTNDPGALLPGAVLMGATLAAMQAISQLYLPDRFGRASALYGAIGTTVVTLGWFFFIGRAFVARAGIGRRDPRALRQHLALRLRPPAAAPDPAPLGARPTDLRPRVTSVRESGVVSTTTPLDTQAAEYERRAQQAEESPLPAIISISKVVVWIFYVIVLLQAIVLTIAFFLRLFGANPDAGFAEWIYRSAETLMGPFRGLFPDRVLSDTSVLDLSLLTAAAFYFLIAFAFDLLLHWLRTQMMRQRRAIAEARATADAVAQQAAAQRYAAEQAALRTAQQTASQYTVAHAAATQALADHERTVPPS